MKKILFWALLFCLFSQANAGNFVYPFDTIAAPKCRFTNWSWLSNDCKITLPRIEKWDYTKYKDNADMRRIYSILWWATYDYGWDVWFGSHLWLDIATSAGTPVRSIGDWEVIVAGWLNWRWNTVVIKHKLSDGKIIYSNYSHMSKITASKWNIKVGTTIWEVGATWNAYGNHLHFQIDTTNQAHPYWYTTCSKWIGIMDVVNEWMCRDYLLSNTIDPILFLEWNWTYTSSSTSISEIKEKQEETKKIEQKNIKTREQILDDEINEYLKSHTFGFSTKVTWDNLKTNSTYITKLYIYEYWKEFNWSLPWNWLTFAYDTNSLKITPANLILAEKWWREVFVSSNKSWKFTINLMLGKRIVLTKTITFYSPWELSSPTDAIFVTNTKQDMSLGDEKKWAVVMKTKFWTNQVYIPYDWTYKLKVLSGKVKFCNVSKKSKKICNPLELASELEFRYEDTKAWVLLFNFIAFDYSPVKFVLQKVWAKYDIARTKYQIRVWNPIHIDSSYVYYNESIDALKKWYLRLNNWYLSQERELIWSQVKDIINNYYSYEYLRAWNDMEKKANIVQKIKDSQTRLAIVDNYKKITRWEFTKMIFENLWINIEKNAEAKLLDEKWFYKDYITTLRNNFSFKWKDQFAENYFQPDKNISVWEALFFIEKIST